LERLLAVIVRCNHGAKSLLDFFSDAKERLNVATPFDPNSPREFAILARTRVVAALV